MNQEDIPESASTCSKNSVRCYHGFRSAQHNSLRRVLYQASGGAVQGTQGEPNPSIPGALCSVPRDSGSPQSRHCETQKRPLLGSEASPKWELSLKFGG